MVTIRCLTHRELNPAEAEAGGGGADSIQGGRRPWEQGLIGEVEDPVSPSGAEGMARVDGALTQSEDRESKG
jgi:hypothetical protein